MEKRGRKLFRNGLKIEEKKFKKERGKMGQQCTKNPKYWPKTG